MVDDNDHVDIAGCIVTSVLFASMINPAHLFKMLNTCQLILLSGSATSKMAGRDVLHSQGASVSNAGCDA